MNRVGHQPDAAGHARVKSQRRQYSSCDRCRQGRRACDAILFGPCSATTTFAGGHFLPERPCAGCLHMEQTCTFDWLLKISHGRLPSSVRQRLGSGWVSNRIPGSKAHPAHTQNEIQGNLAGYTSISAWRELSGSCVARTVSNHRNDLGQRPRDGYNQFGKEASTDDDSANAPFALFPTDQCTFQNIENQSNIQHGSDELFPRALAFSSCVQSLDQAPVASTEKRNSDAIQFNHTKAAKGFEHQEIQHFSPTASHTNENPIITPTSICLFENTVSQKVGRNLLVEILLQVYQGSFENALSCWVTSRNCPYKAEDIASETNASPVSSPTSFFERVKSMDNAFSFLDRPSGESCRYPQASKALQLAIMAFASQWALDPRKENHHSTSTSTLETGPAKESGNLIMESLWNSAKVRIEKCPEISSFQYILAQIVFSLTKCPLQNEWSEDNSSNLGVFGDQLTPQFALDISLSEMDYPRFGTGTHVDDITLHGGGSALLPNPPMHSHPSSYLENALQTLFLWRKKLENPHFDSRAWSHISTDDIRSFYMLFWFGVMCDTTSSVLYGRPLTLSDADTSLCPQGKSLHMRSHSPQPFSISPNCGFDDMVLPPTFLWGSYLLESLQEQSFLQGKSAVRWPCHPNLARKVLQDAIPVKVLLWRKIAQLRKLCQDNCSAHVIERCVAESTQVYNQWQDLYSLFFNDCLFDHANLPFQVRSWYVILGAHWHLACLYLANFIEYIGNDYTLGCTSTARKMALDIRRASAYWISDVAKASYLESSSTSNCLNNQLSAFSSALLTEPCTDVLTEALTKASQILLHWNSMRLNPWSIGPCWELTWVCANTAPDELSAHIKSCTLVLELLGRRFDEKPPFIDPYYNSMEDDSHRCHSSF